MRSPLADKALAIMVFVIVLDIVLVYPLGGMLSGSRAWSEALMSLVLLLAALAIWGNLWLTDVFAATSIACIAARIGNALWPAEELEHAGAALAAVNYTLLCYLLSRRVFAAGRVTVERIQGAVAVYCLAGLVLAEVFKILSRASPGAFLLLGHPASHEEIAPQLIYYSFVALTTTEFGDITPVHPLARSFTIMGAIFGTLYPAILIGRLVSQEVVASERG